MKIDILCFAYLVVAILAAHSLAIPAGRQLQAHGSCRNEADMHRQALRRVTLHDTIPGVGTQTLTR